MLRNWKKILAAGAVLASAPFTMGFSLLGPGGFEGIAAKLWQLPAANDGWDIGYAFPSDIGSPVAFGEFYRWNTPVVTYAFDFSFKQYFGEPGMKAVNEAMQILNDIPPVSSMSADLSEFPLNSAHLNYEAAQLGLVDLKSLTLQFMLEEIGLADPIRWNFGIRERINLPGDFGAYSITRFNYDPVTYQVTPYVNGTLWTYFILEIPPPVMYSEAVEVLPAPLNNEVVNYPVTAFFSGLQVLGGYFYNGLTRDDIGGIRFLYQSRQLAVEPLLADVLPGGGTFSPYLGTNALTNVVVGATNASIGLRGGLGRLPRFKQVNIDPVSQLIRPVNIPYKDSFITTNGVRLKQSVLRTVVFPDITFSADDLFPLIGLRETTATWINNEALNSVTLPRGGPGTITGPMGIIFNNAPRLLFNQTPFFVTEPLITDTNARNFGLLGFALASFDGTTNAPIIYPLPLNYTVREIRNAAAAGGGQ